MTKKVYYDDPYVKELKVQVAGSASDERGQYVVLDQTCFYPEGAGSQRTTG